MQQSKLTILAIGAHPDDLEISCAGTLAKMKQAGHEVVMCHVSNGDKGHFTIPPNELAEIRKKEAATAGALIGCQVETLEQKDGEINADCEGTRTLAIDLIRQVKPDLVITHAPNDYMADHVAVNKLVEYATFFASVPSMKSELPVVKVPALFYMDNLAGIEFQPTIYVDISDTIDLKLNMLSQHESQLKWLKEHDGEDILEFTKIFSRTRGIQAGCAYAEGFIQAMLWARPNAIRFPV